MPDFIALDALVGQTAAIAPDRIAVIDGERQLSYDDLNDLVDRVAAALQADGLKPRDVISICALSSIEYVSTFLGALRVGVAVAPLAPSSTPQDFAAMVKEPTPCWYRCNTAASWRCRISSASISRPFR
jgi:acyl-CoA synthetase (AMP-forming)/AMP-acid ligase II